MSLVLYQNVVGKEARAPLALDRRRRRLSAVVRKHVDTSRPHIVSVHRRAKGYAATERNVKLRSEWKLTTVGKDDVVLVTYLPMGGGGGGGRGKSIVSALAMIALAVAAPYAVGALGVGALGTVGSLTLAGKLLAAGIVVGGGMLLSMASKPKASSGQADRSVYGVNGGGNVPRRGDRIPRLYGRCWNTPDLAQPDYTTYDGEDQILYKRLVIGLGKYQIHSIRVGSLALWDSFTGIDDNFPGAEVELITPGSPSALVPSDVITSPDVSAIDLPRPIDEPEWTPWFPVTPEDVNINRIQLDFSFPEGVASYNDEGTIKARYTDLEWEYAEADMFDEPVGAPEVLARVSANRTSEKPIRVTKIVDVPLGRYVVRGRNMLNESSDPDAAVWEGLRGYTPDVRVRSHVTEIGIKVRSSKELGSVAFSEIQVESTAIIPVWTGTEWEEQATRKAVWAYADIWRNAYYGGAISDSRFDIDVPYHYATTLSEFDTFDGVIRGPVSVYEAGATVLGPMRAEPTYSGRIWSLVRDEPQAGRGHVFTGRQIIKGSTSLDYDTEADDGSADVIVEYERDGDPKKPDEIRVTYGGESLTPRRHRLFGVSSYEHALHLARWMAATGFYRRKKVTFGTELDGRIMSRGDKATVDIWFLNQIRTAGVLSRDLMVLSLDRSVEVEAGDHIVMRGRDGLDFGPIGVTAGPGARQLTMDIDDVAAAEAIKQISIEDVLSNEFEDPTTIRIGTPQILAQNFLIKQVRPQSATRSEVEAVFDHPEVWVKVGEAMPSTPPLPVSNEAPLAPIVPAVYAEVVQSIATLRLNYRLEPAPGAVSYRVEMAYGDAPNDDEWQRIDGGGSTLYGSTPALYDASDPTIQVRAWAIGSTGLAGPVATTSVESVAPVIISEPPPGSVGYMTLAEEVRYMTSRLTLRMEEVNARMAQLAADTGSTVTGGYLQSQKVRTEVRVSSDRTVARVSQAFMAGVNDDEALAALLEEITANMSPAAGADISAAANAFRNMSVRVTDNEVAIAEVEEGVEVIVGESLASGLIRFTAVAGPLPGDVLARVAIEVRAGTEEEFEFAGIYLDATTTGSRITMQADMVAFGDALGNEYPFVFSDGELELAVANIGTVTAGLLKSPDNKVQFDLNNSRLVMYD